MKNGLKVYYLPRVTMYKQSTLPTFFGPISMVRNIFIREQIDVFHGHAVCLFLFKYFLIKCFYCTNLNIEQSCTLVHECLKTANMMNIAVVLTEHSLYDIKKLGPRFVNFVCFNKTICVSFLYFTIIIITVAAFV